MHRRTQISIVASLFAFLLTTTNASAQGADGEEVELGEEIEMEEDYEGKGTEGADETPPPPDTPWNEEKKSEAEVKEAPRPAGYPQERIFRPLTLPRLMIEITLDLPTNVSPFVGDALLGASIGVTAKDQLQLQYSVGSLTEDEFVVGRGFALRYRRSILEGLSAEASLPFWFDSFAMGFGLGVPIRFTFADKFSIVGGEDLINFKVADFPPAVAPAAFNDAQVALDELNQVRSDGNVNVQIGVLYQIDKTLSLEGRFGMVYEDFDNDNTRSQINAKLNYAMGNWLDLHGTIGLADLANASDTFSVNLGAALRL